MSTGQSYTDFAEARSGARAKKALVTRRLIYLHRPIYLHRESKGAGCDCGCRNKYARRVETFEHIDLVVDRQTGLRKLRRDVGDKDAFDRLCAAAQRIANPVICYPEQLPIILDDLHKVIGVWGAPRSGKSQGGSEWFEDRILIRGGPGARFLWVSPTRRQSRIGLRKLVLGEFTAKKKQPLIPSDLVKSWPKTVQAQSDHPVRLIDGSEIWFFHTQDGGNIKGESAVDILFDEVCEVEDAEAFNLLLSRLSDTGGQILLDSSPEPGHWAEKLIKRPGKTYDELAGQEPRRADVVSVSLSRRFNVFLDPEEVKVDIELMQGDELRIRKEIDGEWVSLGQQLWRHFDAAIHVKDGPWRDVAGWGLINITAAVYRRFFRETSADLSFVLGQDFNVGQMHAMQLQIGCPPNLDQSNPANWIAFFLDEIVKQGDVRTFADHLANKAAGYRKLPADYFKGRAIACDPTGAQAHPHAVHNLSKSSTLHKVMIQHGFDCRPCHRSEKGKAASPPLIDGISMMHKLMADRVDFDGTPWPRFIVHATRCPEFVLSLETEIADEKGRPKYTSNTRSDVRKGPSDAARYILWAAMGTTEFRTRKPSFPTMQATH